MSWCGFFYGFLAAIGLRLLLDIVTWFLSTRGKVSPQSLKAKGGYALVTGSTAGIGEAFAKECARLGFNLILVSRTRSKLEEQAQSLKQQYKVECEVVPFDFSAPQPDWSPLVEVAQRLPISILINNVGINIDFPMPFHEVPIAEADAIIRTNIDSINHMCHMVIPGMLVRKGGAIINLSSFTGRVPTPLLTVYSGTKVYADWISDALSTEYARHGITALSVTPNFVASAMTRMKPSFTVAAPELVARQSLARLGNVRTAPYWVHSVMEWLLTNFPRFITAPIIYNANKKIYDYNMRRKANKNK